MIYVIDARLAKFDTWWIYSVYAANKHFGRESGAKLLCVGGAFHNGYNWTWTLAFCFACWKHAEFPSVTWS